MPTDTGLPKMNTETDLPIVLSYPAWVKAISWFGVPVLSLIALWLISRPVWEDVTTTQFVVGAVMGFAVLYQCVMGVFALQYLNMRITLLDEGLQISYRNSIKIVPWSLTGKVKEYPFATMTRLSDVNGQTIIYAFDNMENLGVLKSVLNERSNEFE